MSTSDSCKDSASKSNDDGVCEMNDELNKMSLNATDDGISVCGNCGKEGNDINNVCNKCKQVKYCNAACKKKHRHKHKKECDEHFRLASEKHKEELKLASELHDEELFKQPPSAEDDCPICFIRLPTLNDCPICFEQLPSLKSGINYMSCCGKVLCNGCMHAPVYDSQGNKAAEEKCPFCRTLTPRTRKEHIKREKKRTELDDPIAIYNTGNYYRDGRYGFPQDYGKALEHWHKSGKLGYVTSFLNIGYAYQYGEGVEIDENKAAYYLEIAAIRGDVQARYNLGISEEEKGNIDRALKHFMIGIRGGHADSLQLIKELYSNGDVKKEDYTQALKFYQAYLGDIKSSQRDEAAAAREDCRYY